MRLSGTKTGAVNQYRGLGNQLWDLAGNRPSLDLPFSDTKSLVDTATGKTLVNHTRASSGTYVDGDGLIKTATTNLLTWSEDITNTGWSTPVGGSTDPDQELAPNGTLTADHFISTSGIPILRKTVTVTNGVTYTISFYARLVSGGNQLKVDLGDGTEGTFTLTSSWQRFNYTIAATANQWLDFRLTSAGTVALWGAQLEQSTAVGEYVKTTSTINSATRFHHDPTTGESLGLLVEESRANQITYSEDFEDTSWSKFNISITGTSGVSPDGSANATELTPGNANSRTYASVTTSADDDHTFSVFAKAGTGRYVTLRSVGYGTDKTAVSYTHLTLPTKRIV